ncbi:S1 RNA-binding domain-containing protein [Streptomyces sp. NPDC098781]|uniref:S1 RNA-binding domain-containing protein n=1 Tax=Streptomyces sp. NPDC098781 TaxID=3366097 RepID=UPI00380444F5
MGLRPRWKGLPTGSGTTAPGLRHRSGVAASRPASTSATGRLGCPCGRRSQTPSWSRCSAPEDAVQVGDQLTVVVTDVDPERRRLSLSRRQA